MASTSRANFAQRDGIDLYYELAGNPAGPPMLLIPGLGMQMIDWPDHFIEPLAAQFQLILMDNRDRGLSTTLHGAPSDAGALLEAMLSGQEPDIAYLLSDMGDDAAAVLESVGADQAHVVGISMGGMIAQTLTLQHPERVASLASIMSTTGAPDVGQPTPEALTAIMSAPPENTREAMIAAGVENIRVWASPDHYDPEEMAVSLAASWDRVGGAQAEGTARQTCAIVASPARDEALASVQAPTVVIHGTADKLVTPSGGERTAACIPGAELLLIDGMGHDVPKALVDHVVGGVTRNAASA